MKKVTKPASTAKSKIKGMRLTYQLKAALFYQNMANAYSSLEMGIQFDINVDPSESNGKSVREIIESNQKEMGKLVRKLISDEAKAMEMVAVISSTDNDNTKPQIATDDGSGFEEDIP